jgi:type IV secretion system protein VirB9
VVRFIYPAQDTPKPAAARPAEIEPVRKNIAYTYLGAREALPALVFDDGNFTYFRWPQAAETPAIFLLNNDGAESLVNYTVRNGYFIVEQVARRFVLRNGQAVTTLINDAWAPPASEPDAPKPHQGGLKLSGAKP